MMLFVHSAGGVLGALAALLLWAYSHPLSTPAEAALPLLFGSLVGTIAGHLIEERNKKN